MGELEDEGDELRDPNEAESAEFDEDWPVLSDLDLEVAISESIPGVEPPSAEEHKARARHGAPRG